MIQLHQLKIRPNLGFSFRPQERHIKPTQMKFGLKRMLRVYCRMPNLARVYEWVGIGAPEIQSFCQNRGMLVFFLVP